ncbi:TlpA family protein disulfide reductase [Ancylomarina euxinus]|uniref:TlpA family protein disulfide reductase n=1 Tax=Ancylomarina euxinus TaxID=2283627 RepID=A0A425Y7U5_9BACT|nr:TlpA disulfide reductase family protein [Ancylomarina euxinus]MCZ4693568.1 TlpA disulfide reductase family protein [Ancylomarina euxinus]MUP13796.1 redoxin domain-containing protein [Ancylomarina euxinus]RRG24570.1 TlpA family protein disulfide reductase [Ancylomarina euxinus]
MKRYLLLVLALVFTSSLWADENEGNLTKKGQLAPDFTITSLDGDLFKLSDLKGKVILVNFFATWCGPCMKELPELEKQLWPRFKNENFKMISIGREHTVTELKKFQCAKEFTFPIAADPQRHIYAKYAEKYIPRNYIIDKEGYIIFQGKGFSQKELDEMMEIIEKAMKE